jgi:hypothetical protein
LSFEFPSEVAIADDFQDCIGLSDDGGEGFLQQAYRFPVDQSAQKNKMNLPARCFG